MDASRGTATSRSAEKLGHSFSKLDLLETALTHSSAASELGLANNERLEFLGDAVLELIASEWLFQKHPLEPEGMLTQRRSRLVSAAGLKQVADRLGLGHHIRLSVGEDRSGGRLKRSVLADTVEAVLGAVFLDGGLGAARTWILPQLEWLSVQHASENVSDVKNRLQELLQRDGGKLPEYRTVREDGPAHARCFAVECWVHDRLVATGSGSSKKEAQRGAAQAALSVLDAQK